MVLVLLVAGWHLVAVTAAALPPNRYSSAAEPMTGYLRPYFTQNWRLFAPNPVAADRAMLFQATYRDSGGQTRQTEWVDWTAVELDLVHHRIVGNRGGYVTSKLIEALSASRRGLTSAQRDVLLEGSADEPTDWDELTDRLGQQGSPLRAVSALRYERATTRLATDVLRHRFPDLQIVSVRYSIHQTPVVPYSRRHLPEDQREALRVTNETNSGWRVPVEGSEAERKVVAEFDARHR